tara:strand:+ start:160 stop:381 length:222 start_codon:yes stop_codon:yes gene_type:complete
MDKYKRLKHGEASFTLEERFDDVEKAANPSTEGEFVEIKISNLKIDFTKVIKEQNDRDKKSSTEADGQAKKKE